MTTVSIERRLWGSLASRWQAASAWLLLVLCLAGCGGGSSGGGGNPPPSGDFSISVPTSASVAPGLATSVTVGVTARNGFSGQVSLTISGMPAGVTATPSTFTLGPGNQQSVVIAASLSAATANSTLTVTGTAGSRQHSGQIALQIGGAQGPLPAAARIRYIQTDTQWDTTFFNFFPQVLILYHPSTHRFFVSDTYLNQVVVIDARTEATIAQIPVPGAFVGDIS